MEAPRRREKTPHQLEQEFRRIVLDNKDHALGAARDILEAVSDEAGLGILLAFNRSEGCLPGELQHEYLKRYYSSLRLKELIDGGLSLFEALASLDRGSREQGVYLDKEAVQARVRECIDQLKAEYPEIVAPFN